MSILLRLFSLYSLVRVVNSALQPIGPTLSVGVGDRYSQQGQRELSISNDVIYLFIPKFELEVGFMEENLSPYEIGEVRNVIVKVLLDNMVGAENVEITGISMKQRGHRRKRKMVRNEARVLNNSATQTHHHSHSGLTILSIEGGKAEFSFSLSSLMRQELFLKRVFGILSSHEFLLELKQIESLSGLSFVNAHEEVLTPSPTITPTKSPTTSPPTENSSSTPTVIEHTSTDGFLSDPGSESASFETVAQIDRTESARTHNGPLLLGGGIFVSALLLAFAAKRRTRSHIILSTDESSSDFDNNHASRFSKLKGLLRNDKNKCYDVEKVEIKKQVDGDKYFLDDDDDSLYPGVTDVSSKIDTTAIGTRVDSFEIVPTLNKKVIEKVMLETDSPVSAGHSKPSESIFQQQTLLRPTDFSASKLFASFSDLKPLKILQSKLNTLDDEEEFALDQNWDPDDTEDSPHGRLC